MLNARYVLPISAVSLLLVLAYLYFSGVPPGGSYDSGVMTPIPPTSRVEDVSEDPAPGGGRESDLPPESALAYGGGTVRSAGEIIGGWEPRGWFVTRSYSTKNPTSSDLPLTDGDFLTVPRGATLEFRYGGEVDLARDVFYVASLAPGRWFCGQDNRSWSERRPSK